MNTEKGGRPPAATRKVVRITTERARIATSPELRMDGEWLEVNFAAADIPDGKFRYSLGKRYLLAWADGTVHGQQHFVLFPRPVEPKDHTVTFHNGVVDARVRVTRRT